MESLVSRGLHAPLFEQVIKSLDPDRRCVVLDFGSARSGTVALLSGFRCCLEIVGLAELLPQLHDIDEASDRRIRLRSSLAARQSEPCNLVLCWNLLNYLQPQDVSLVAELLARRLAPDGRMHALIEYSSPVMPASPGHWTPDGSARLFADQPDIEQIPSPRYSPRTLERLMPQMQPERTILLGNGLHEHLFRLRA